MGRPAKARAKASGARRVIGYVRVSTEHQADKGVSLEVQREKVRAYAALHDLELVGIIEDAGVSAKDLDRPGLRRALDVIAAGDAAGLVVLKLDRLSRSVRDWALLIDEYFGEKARRPAHLYSVSDSIDTTTAAGRLVLNMLMSVAQWEREIIGERTASALRLKRDRGEVSGTIPLGRARAGDGKQLTEEPSEAAAVARIVELRALGMSIRAITARLNDEGHAARGQRWHKTTVERVLRRASTTTGAVAA